MYINGEWVDAVSGATFGVTNPATGESLGEVPAGAAEDAERAVEAADAAFASWSATTVYERADLLMATWNLMRERANELAELMTAEQGKPLRASKAEVNYGADFL
ncbi:MAG: aldehyde dehydrogenase family protein, partial [Acidimicrobiales bacterium]